MSQRKELFQLFQKLGKNAKNSWENWWMLEWCECNKSKWHSTKWQSHFINWECKKSNILKPSIVNSLTLELVYV